MTAGNKPDIFLYPILTYDKGGNVAQNTQQNLLYPNDTALNLAQSCFLTTILMNPGPLSFVIPNSKFNAGTI